MPHRLLKPGVTRDAMATVGTEHEPADLAEGVAGAIGPGIEQFAQWLWRWDRLDQVRQSDSLIDPISPATSS